MGLNECLHTKYRDIRPPHAGLPQHRSSSLNTFQTGERMLHLQGVCPTLKRKYQELCDMIAQLDDLAVKSTVDLKQLLSNYLNRSRNQVFLGI